MSRMWYVDITPRLLVVAVVLVGLTKGQNPEIVNDILPEVQMVGRTARLNCTVARLGQNSVQWAFLRPTSKYVISVNTEIKALNYWVSGIPQYDVKTYPQEGDRVTFQLVIARIRPEFSGPYECTVAVSNMKDFEHWTSKTGNLTVLYPPHIIPGSTQYIKMVEKGANDTIMCDAGGEPSPNITWARSDGKLLPTGRALFRGKILPIKHASEDVTGVYRCVADNHVKPPAEALIQINVYQEPSVRVLQDSVGQHANGRYESKLDCIVSGFPTPSVNWGMFQGEAFNLITNNDKFETSKQVTDMQNLMNGEQWYTLKIRNVQDADFKKYYCVAKNYKGKKNATVEFFQTYDCQGPLCYSMKAENAEGAAAPSTRSPRSYGVLALSLVLVALAVRGL